MSDEYEFQISCYVCDAETDVAVINIDEKPNFCPMCGEEAAVKVKS